MNKEPIDTPKTKEEIIREYEKWDNEVPQPELELVELDFIFEELVVEENSK